MSYHGFEPYRGGSADVLVVVTEGKAELFSVKSEYLIGGGFQAVCWMVSRMYREQGKKQPDYFYLYAIANSYAGPGNRDTDDD